MTEKGQTAVGFLLAMAGLGGLLYGIDFGTIAAAMPYIRALGLFSDAQLSVVVGAVLFGGIVSSLTAGFLAERFGRKRLIVASAALFLVAVPVVCLSGGSFVAMAFGRVLQGMSAGYMSVVMPMYLTETLPPAIRGRGTGVFQFCLGLGLVLAATVGYAVAATFGESLKDLAWKVNFWWTMLPVAVLFFGSLRLKESPAWEGRGKEGRRKKEEGRSEAGQPFDVLSADANTDKKPKKTSLFPSSFFLLPFLQRRYVLPFILAVLVLTFNKTTGMSSITSYSVVIFQKAGFAGSLGNVGDFAIKLTNLLVTVVAAALVDRMGRTFLLKLGTAGMTLGLAAIGAVFLAVERFGVEANAATGALCLAAFFLMQVFYALGPGLCVWLVLSELMPQRIRANGMAFALFMNQLVAWGLASTFLPWVNRWGWNSMFFFFAANGVLYFITACLIPETKGKTLEELETLFEKKGELLSLNTEATESRRRGERGKRSSS